MRIKIFLLLIILVVIDMKYIKYALVIMIPLLIMCACSLGNTPTSKVEDLFTKYQKLDKDITTQIDNVLNNADLNQSDKDRYRKIMEKQYRNLTYEIKDERIDGDNAIVTVTIEVLDYKKVVDTSSVDSDKIDRLEKVKDKVKYTLDLEVYKDKDGNWTLNNLTETDIKKIEGMY